MRTGAGPAVATRDLRMKYGPREVLQGLDLDVGRGEVVALLGPNGAGKTTTIEILEGFRRRSAGEVTVLGSRSRSRRRGVAGPAGHRAPVLARPRELAGARAAVLPRPLLRPVRHAEAGPGPMTSTTCSPRSGSPRRRAQREGRRALRWPAPSPGRGRRLVGRPDLLFLDEPTAGFDPQARQEFHDLVHRTADRGGDGGAAHHARPGRGREARRPHRDPRGGRIVADGTAASWPRRWRPRRGPLAPRAASRTATECPTRPRTCGSCSPARARDGGASQRPGHAHADAGGRLPGSWCEPRPGSESARP